MNIIPLPNFYKKEKGKISFSNYRIIIQPKYQNSVIQFNHELEEKLNVDDSFPLYTFEFEINNELKSQEYRITMQKEITLVEGKDEYAFYLATRSLAMLLNLHSISSTNKIESDIFYIDDNPRFLMRSFMIDEVRHFFGKEKMFQLIDLLSLLKFNYLHWHLSDDQGFRINFKTFPNLEKVASKRNNTKIESQDNDAYDNHPYEHCYSYEDVKEIINYAKKHYIEIIPEIDVPGHTSAIVAAYKELHCFNKENDVPGYFGVFKEIICPGKESTYTFFKKLFDELLLLFKDSKYIHIGGDEVTHTNWEICPDCKAMMKKLNLTSTNQLQTHFTNEIAKYILDKGRKVIVWNDGIFDNVDNRVIMQYWDWKMDKPRIEYINNGRKTIYSPCSQVYFNDPYAELPLIKTYNRGIHLEGLNKSALKNIIAIEGCIWTEWIDNGNMLDFMLNPRLEALSEACWTYSTNHNFTSFKKRMEKFYRILDSMKIDYCSLKTACPTSKKYKDEISKRYRKDEKYVEYQLDKKSKH